MERKFKLKSIGVDLSTINEKLSSDLAKEIWGEDNYLFDYIVTSINSNNDYILKEFTRYASSTCNLITVVDQLETLEDLLVDHFSTVQELYNVKGNTILLNTTDQNLDLLDVTYIKDLQNSDIISTTGVGIYCPTSIAQITELKTKLNSFNVELSKVAVNNCPLSFQHAIIKWCSDNNVEIIGFNPFGGHLTAPTVINSFGSNYSLTFSAFHCNYVILSGRDLVSNLVRLNDMANYLLEMTDSVVVKNPELYELKKSINKLIKPLTKVIYNSVKISENLVLDYEFYSGKLSLENTMSYLNKSVTIIPDINSIDEKSHVVSKVNELLPQLKTVTTFSIKNRYAFIRYRLERFIKLYYPGSDNWTMELIPVTDKSVIFKLVQKNIKKGFWKSEVAQVEYDFLLVVPDENHTLFIDL